MASWSLVFMVMTVALVDGGHLGEQQCFERAKRWGGRFHKKQSIRFDSHSYTWPCFQTNGFVNEYKPTNTTCLQSLRRVEGFREALLTSGKWFKAPKSVLKLCAVIRNFRSALEVNKTACATIFTGTLVARLEQMEPFALRFSQELSYDIRSLKSSSNKHLWPCKTVI